MYQTVTSYTKTPLVWHFLHGAPTQFVTFNFNVIRYQRFRFRQPHQQSINRPNLTHKALVAPSVTLLNRCHLRNSFSESVQDRRQVLAVVDGLAVFAGRAHRNDPSTSVANRLHGGHIDALGGPLVVHDPSSDRTDRSDDDRQPLDRGVELETAKNLRRSFNGSVTNGNYTHRNSWYLSWLVQVLLRETPSWTQNTGRITFGRFPRTSWSRTGSISRLNCSRLAAETGVPEIWKISIFIKDIQTDKALTDQFKVDEHVVILPVGFKSLNLLQQLWIGVDKVWLRPQ